MRIRAVTFDLWLTLIWDTEELNEYWRLRRLVNFHRFVKKSHGDVSFNDVRLAIEELGAKTEPIYARGQDLPPEERGRMILDSLGVRFPPGEAERLYAQAGKVLSNSGYLTRYPHLNAQARPTLSALKREFPGIKIGLISNAARSTAVYRRILERLGVARYFDTLTISCEVGSLKPHRKIFQTTLDALSVEPHQVVHVGDSFRADVVGATSMGMDAALYTGLWHRHGKHHNTVSEHVPKDFVPSRPVAVSEISRLQDVLEMVRRS